MLLCGTLFAAPASAAEHCTSAREHEIHFAGTDHELHVYRINGREPGATVLIIGGIHGNEPGGYLASDKYVDLTLERGNLIVVPRANLNSVLTDDRGRGGDYNRKFNTVLREDSFDDQVVAVLKKLISESDLLLNLHDGSGFYRDAYIDKMHNPYRFGQSVIADSESYYSGRYRRELQLGEIARRVVDQVNGQIDDQEYHFHFSNHDSISPDTRYPEMRKTATYFALTEHEIPAYGIETSKSLPSTEMKLAHQVLVINAFLDEFGVVIDVPDRVVEAPRFDYAVLALNGEEALVVRDGGSVEVETGSRVSVDRLVGNYERYMFADLQGYGGFNDNGREVTVSEPISVVVRKDSRICGNFKILPAAAPKPAEAGTLPLDSAGAASSANFIVEVNGIRQLVPAEGEIKVVMGDKLVVRDYIAPKLPQGINVNFLGFVGNPDDNRGEDRGYLVDTANDLLVDWSVGGRGERYAIAVKNGRRELTRMTIHLLKPKLDYVVVRRNEEHPQVLQTGEAWQLSRGDRLTILGSHSNAPDDYGLRYLLLDSTGVQIELKENSFVAPVARRRGDRLTLAVMRGSVTMGSVRLLLTSAAAEAQTSR